MGVANYISLEDGRITLFPVTERRLFSWTKTRKVRRLLSAFADERLNADLRTMAAIGLGKTKAVEAVRPLAEVLTGKGSAHLRRQCAAALGRIEHPDAYDALRTAAYDTEMIVRRPAISALGPFIDDERVDVLVPMLRDKDRDVREAAYVAIGRSRVSDKLSVLVHGLGDPDENVRGIAAAQIGFLKDARSIPSLIEYIEVDGHLNHRALIALSKFSREELGAHYETYRKLAQQEARTLRRMGF